MATYIRSKFTTPEGDVINFKDKVSGYTTNEGTVTSVTAGVGLTTSDGNAITSSGTIKAKLKSETASSLTAADKGSTANREYAVGIDASGNLSVNVPWESGSSGGTYGPATNGGLSMNSSNEFSITNSIVGDTAGTSTDTSGNTLDVPYITYDDHGLIIDSGTHQHTITNNITGSGTSGSLAKFNGSNTLTDGPEIGSAINIFLNNSGNWAVPVNRAHCTLPTISANSTSAAKVTVDAGRALTSTDIPILGVYIDTAANRDSYNADWAKVYRANAGYNNSDVATNNSIKFYADEAVTGGETIYILY